MFSDIFAMFPKIKRIKKNKHSCFALWNEQLRKKLSQTLLPFKTRTSLLSYIDQIEHEIALHLRKICYATQAADQSVHMCMLIRTFVVCIRYDHVFLLPRLKWLEYFNICKSATRHLQQVIWAQSTLLPE